MKEICYLINRYGSVFRDSLIGVEIITGNRRSHILFALGMMETITIKYKLRKEITKVMFQ